MTNIIPFPSKKTDELLAKAQAALAAFSDATLTYADAMGFVIQHVGTHHDQACGDNYPVYALAHSGKLLAGPEAALCVFDVAEVLQRLEDAKPSRFKRIIREYVAERNAFDAEMDADPEFLAFLEAAR